MLLKRCVVCFVYCDDKNIQSHISDVPHITLLSKNYVALWKGNFRRMKQAVIILLYILMFQSCLWLSDFPTRLLLIISLVSAVFNISCTCWSWLQVWVSHWNVSRMTTEVAGNPLVGHTVLSARHYESGPPANANLEVVSTYCMFRQLFLYFEHGSVNSTDHQPAWMWGWDT